MASVKRTVKVPPSVSFSEYIEVGHNVEYVMEGDILVLRIDCSDDAKNNAPTSQSGKSKVVGSTSGFIRVNGVSFSLNVITK